MKFVNVADLHIHTNASDGAHPLSEVIRRAREADLEIIAITDHDSVAAFDEPTDSAWIEVIRGVELSAEHENREVHILGYFLDIANEELRATLSRLQQMRRNRLNSILEKLSNLNVHISPQDVHVLSDSSIGRLHVAELLIERGYVGTVYEAFRDFLGSGGSAYVAKTRLSVGEAVRLVHTAGGAAVLAHPGNFFTRYEVIGFAAEGLDGLEVHYPSHSPFDTEIWAQLAVELDLVPTGGSDFHGRAVNEIDIGAVRISRQDVRRLEERSRGHGNRRVL